MRKAKAAGTSLPHLVPLDLVHTWTRHTAIVILEGLSQGMANA